MCHTLVFNEMLLLISCIPIENICVFHCWANELFFSCHVSFISKTKHSTELYEVLPSTMTSMLSFTKPASLLVSQV